MASPSKGEAGLTGQWRVERPVIEHEKCLAAQAGKPVCMQCWLYCPEAVVTKTVPVMIDLDFCKGCGICAAVCRGSAITMVPERECDTDE